MWPVLGLEVNSAKPATYILSEFVYKDSKVV